MWLSVEHMPVWDPNSISRTIHPFPAPPCVAMMAPALIRRVLQVSMTKILKNRCTIMQHSKEKKKEVVCAFWGDKRTFSYMENRVLGLFRTQIKGLKQASLL